MFQFAGTQHFNNLSSIFNISDIAISPAAATPGAHFSRWGRHAVGSKYSAQIYPERNVKNIIYIHNLQMLNVLITSRPK